MAARQDFRVIVSGAGPVGCVCALRLAEAGIPVLLLEKNTALPEDLRASTFHPPTLDMLAELGLTEFLIAEGLIARTYQYRDRETGIFAEFDLNVLKDIVDHPFRVQCEQFKLTRHVVALLEKHPNAEVRLGTALTGYVQDDGGIEAICTGPAGEERVRADYLIGTDGARSTVRERMAVEFEGFTYPEQFLVVATDAPLERQLPGLAPVNYVSASEDWCVVLRVLGSWRILFPTEPGQEAEKITAPEVVEARLQRLAPQDAPFEILHKSLYRIHQRVAKSYRDGRALIAGDAAHLNNPLGGMGMNGGIHDVINLTDKLLPVLAGTAPDSLLDLYDRQRRIVTWEHIQEQTIRNKKAIEEANGDARIQRIRDLQKTAADLDASIAYLRQHNMLNALDRAAAIT